MVFVWEENLEWLWEKSLESLPKHSHNWNCMRGDEKPAMVSKDKNRWEVWLWLTVGHERRQDPELAAGAEDEARGQQVWVAEEPGQENLVLRFQTQRDVTPLN